MATKTDGTLWSWGYNNYGQLGLGNVTYYSSPKQVGALTTWYKVAAVDNFALATKTDGTLWAWGDNTYGQIGDGTTTARSSPVQVGALTAWYNIAGGGGAFSLDTKTDGTLWSWGRNQSGQLGLGDITSRSSPNQVGALTTWLNIAGGNAQTLAIKTDSALWSWGQNNQGQLGLGNITYYSSPKQVGGLSGWLNIAANYFSAAIKS
jgi:alpha-tubulin suppressor-like RCC1 family protein